MADQYRDLFEVQACPCCHVLNLAQHEAPFVCFGAARGSARQVDAIYLCGFDVVEDGVGCFTLRGEDLGLVRQPFAEGWSESLWENMLCYGKNERS